MPKHEIPQGLRNDLDTICELVCDYTGFELEALRGRCRRRELVRARQLAIYLAYAGTEATHPVLAAYFCRDRATVYHAIKISQQRFLRQPETHLAKCAKWVAEQFFEETHHAV